MLIETAGFESEVHFADTEDGYILKVHRIKKSNGNTKTSPVFMMHGLTGLNLKNLIFQSFFQILFQQRPQIIFGRHQILLCVSHKLQICGTLKIIQFSAYLLSENGFDIWLGNARGTDHSLRHKTLKTDSKEFWDFSWHEIGFYDVPAMFDLMLKVTNTSKGFYVGHSQGGTSFFVMTSSRPEFNRKIMQGHLMAPAVFMNHVPNPLGKMVMNEIEVTVVLHSERSKKKLFQALSADMKSYNMKVDAKTIRYIKVANDAMCGPMPSACSKTMNFICGFNKGEEELDPRILPTYFDHVAHSISIKQILHYIQLSKSGTFSRFDYGSKNVQFYNSTSPPQYPLQNVKTPTFIYAGSCDMIVSERDIEHLSEVLPNVKKYKVFKNFNHCDFMYGKNSRPLLFNDILKAMRSANS